ncbi:MAG: TIGR03936 family radical SAM-associated protein [Planctomycetota bacterium]
MRVRFTKLGNIRFISHHDLMKVFERAIRRANIPVSMTQGFNPHPIFSIPLALGVGIVGRDEILELDLNEPMSPDALKVLLSPQLPEEIQVLSAESIPHFTKSSVSEAEYEVDVKDNSLLNTINISNFLQQSSINVTRIKNGQQKHFDIRPSIQKVEVKADRLIFSLKMTSDGMARPEEVVRTLLASETKVFFEIIRTKVNLSSSG